jgi:hypothetical protein
MAMAAIACLNTLLGPIAAAEQVLTHIQTDAEPELVLYDGSVIEARNAGSSVSITAGANLVRTFAWKGCSLESHPSPRRSRWFGSMGVYDPAAYLGGPITKQCDGIFRTVTQEGQIHFDDEEFLREWLRRLPTRPTVLTNSGLVVSWDFVPSRRQLNVDLWLVCLNGKPATWLAESSDSSVTVKPSGDGRTLHKCVSVGPEVAVQTRKQYEDFWKQIDQFRLKPNR